MGEWVIWAIKNNKCNHQVYQQYCTLPLFHIVALSSTEMVRKNIFKKKCSS